MPYAMPEKMHTADEMWISLIRVSTDRQAEEGESLETQRLLNNGVIEKNKGSLHKEYFEEGISAYKKRVHQRPVMVEMLNEVAAGRAKNIVAYKRDRICRDPMDYYLLRDAFSKAGVKVFLTCGTETWGDPATNSPTEELLDGLMPLLAKFESMTTSQRVRSNIQAIVQRGEWRNGRPPYGYRYDRDTKRVAQVSSQVETVRLIHDLYVQGYGAGQIADLLNNKYRIPYESAATDKGKKRNLWYPEVVLSVITKPTYMGVQAWGGEWYDCPAIDPIFTKEEWQEAYAIHQKKQTKVTPHKYYNTVFLFKDILYCAECGEKFVPSYHKRRYKKQDGTDSIYEYYEYRCEGRWDKLNGCKQRVHRRQFIEDALVAHIGELIKDFDIDELYRALLDRIKQDTREYNQQMLNLTAEIKNAEKTAEQYVAAYLEAPTGSTMRATLLAKHEEAVTRVGQIKEELDTLQQNRPKEDVEKSEVAKLYESMMKWQGIMANLNIGREVKRKLALEVVERIEVDDQSRFDVRLRVTTQYPN